MLQQFSCDLHNHTNLSPCADPDMTPETLVAAAVARHIDMIAVTDHNSSGNVAAVIAAAAGTGLAVVPGMEVTAREEVHVLALFDDHAALQQFETHVFGDEQPRSLIDPAPYRTADLITLIHRHGGLAVASHIDRDLFSVLSRYGRIPDSAAFDALEVSAACGIVRGRQRYPELARYAFITSSDAHSPADIGRARTTVILAAPRLVELERAFAGSGGRAVAV